MDNVAADINSKPLNNSKKVLSFFIKLSLLFTVWYIINNFYLLPHRTINRPLTNFISMAVVKTVNIFSEEPITWKENAVLTGTYLTTNNNDNNSLLGIAYICNGLDLIFIYLSVIILLPYPIKRKLVFGLGGIVVIIAANVVRISALYFIYVYQRNSFDFSHHYLFTISMYMLIFYGWVLFVKKRPQV